MFMDVQCFLISYFLSIVKELGKIKALRGMDEQ